MTVLVTLLDGGLLNRLVHVSALKDCCMGLEQRFPEMQPSHAFFLVSMLKDLCMRVQVVSVQGPAISMGLPYVHAAVDAGSVEVPVMLSGPNMLPVSASLSVSQRMLSQGTLPSSI